MALGLAFSPDKLCSPLDLTPEESKKQWEYKQKVFRFSKEFEKEYGSTLCNDIHPQVTGKSYDFMNLDDLQQFVLDDGAKKCRVPPEKAARIIAEILLEK